MPTYRFTYEIEADDVDAAYDIARDRFDAFDVWEVDDAE